MVQRPARHSPAALLRIVEREWSKARMSSDKTGRVALFMLRVSLGVFLMILSVGARIGPGRAVRILSHFCGLPIGPGLAIGVDAAEGLV